MPSRDASVFVNPYTFVPLPIKVPRHPYTHRDAVRGRNGEELLYGYIDVVWTLQTPMLLPENAQKQGWIEPGGKIRIPGSTLKGVIRSVHETLFNGCLRVVDPDYVPVHREPVEEAQKVRSEGWRLGIVVSADEEGTPTKIKTARSAAAWVDAEALKANYGSGPLGVPRTGDFVTFKGQPAEHNRRRVIEAEVEGDVVRPSGENRGSDILSAIRRGAAVVIVTATDARPERANGARTHWWWATSTFDRTEPLMVSEEAIVDFQRSAKGSRDLEDLAQEANQQWKQQTQYAPVRRPADSAGPPLGERACTTGRLFVGDVVWVRTQNKKIDKIKASMVWRAEGEHDVAERLRIRNQDALPCPGSDHVCLSCDIFGAIDAEAERGKGEQTGLRGRVRIGSALSDCVAERAGIERLAPMGSPRPSTGSFYLQRRTPDPNRPRGDTPAHWGGTTDRTVRRMRGRKFYWHSDPDEQREHWREKGMSSPRYKGRDSQTAMVRDAELVHLGLDEKPVSFTQRIAIDGLTRAEFFTLQAALKPELILGSAPSGRGFALRVGGGKAFGLGSVTTEVTTVRVGTAEERYMGGEAHAGHQIETHDETANPWLPEGQVTPRKDAVAKVLDRGGLGEYEYHVTYPPNPDTDWNRVGDDAFVQSYAWFSEFNGHRSSTGTKTYRSLPEITDPSQTLKITRG